MQQLSDDGSKRTTKSQPFVCQCSLNFRECGRPFIIWFFHCFIAC